MYKLGVWWQRCNDHWNKGGGYIAARLWWTAFLLTVLVIVSSALRVWHPPKSATAITLSNLKQVGTALHMYLQDYDEHLPPMADSATFERVLLDYTKQPQLFYTPHLNVPYAVNSSLSQRPLKAYPNVGDTVAVWDTRLYRGGEYRAVGFLDGHAELVPTSEWARLRAASGISSDTPPPPELPWWDARSEGHYKRVTAVLNSLVLAAFLSAFLASWREAWRYAEDRHPFTGYFGWWFLVRFIGYGFLMTLAAVGGVVGVGGMISVLLSR